MTNGIKTLKRTLNIQKLPNYSNSITGSEKKCRLLSIAAVIDEDWHKRRHWGARRGEKSNCVATQSHANPSKWVTALWGASWPIGEIDTGLYRSHLVPSSPFRPCPQPPSPTHPTSDNAKPACFKPHYLTEDNGRTVFFCLKIGSFSCQFVVGVRCC